MSTVLPLCAVPSITDRVRVRGSVACRVRVRVVVFVMSCVVVVCVRVLSDDCFIFIFQYDAPGV